MVSFLCMADSYVFHTYARAFRPRGQERPDMSGRWNGRSPAARQKGHLSAKAVETCQVLNDSLRPSRGLRHVSGSGTPPKLRSSTAGRLLKGLLRPKIPHLPLLGWRGSGRGSRLRGGPQSSGPTHWYRLRTSASLPPSLRLV